jgi:flagellar hook-associated protein 2
VFSPELKYLHVDEGVKMGTAVAPRGITTEKYAQSGKLVIDEKKLKSKIAADPDKVLALFTQASSVGYSQYNTNENKKLRFDESGLLWRINDIVKNNLSAIGKKGPLILLVGSPDNEYEGNTTYSKLISDAEESIGNLQDRLTSEQDRYWTKFTAMESALSQLNSTSSWLTSQLAVK